MQKNKEKLSAKELYNQYGIILILVVFFAFWSIIAPNFLSSSNLLNMIRQISFVAIIALGTTLVIITGGMDLSSGSIVGLVAVISADFSHPGEYPLIVPFLVGIAVGAVCGLISGLLISKLNVPPFIATLGMMTSVRGLAYLYSDGRPINDICEGYKFIGSGHILGIPVPIVILIVLTIIMYVILDHTTFGRHILAVGGNEQAAKISGIKVAAVKTSVYVIAGVLSAISGMVMTARIASGQPTAGEGYEMDAVASSVIGGVSLRGGIGTIWGTICGALVISMINNGMDLVGINAYWQQITTGVIIVVAVILDQLKHKKA